MMKLSGYAYFFGAAITAAVAMGGCSSSSESPSSGPASALGESCGRTADCASDLVCIAQTCVTKGTVVNDAGVIVPVSDSGTPIPPPTADAGTGPAPDAAAPRLSALGESCQKGSDCGANLYCAPIQPYGFAGVCDLLSYNLSASGKTCSGECNTAADCCQLPVFNPSITLNSPSSQPIAIHTCADILQGVLAGNAGQCATAPASGPVNEGCFLYQTYCNCGANTWSCNQNTCQYAAACSNSTAYSLGGCPAQSRIHTGLVTTCTTGACSPPVGVPPCTNDASCDGKGTADTGVMCRNGDCACVASQGCLLKCNTELDCGEGYSCDTTKHLCEQNGACTTDADCAVKTGNVDAKCHAGQCMKPCATDHDCSAYSGAAPIAGDTFNGQICGNDKFCHTLGCQSDADCTDTSAGNNPLLPHRLCTTPNTTTTPVNASAFKN